MELKDTINLMKSGDYKRRFIAEYWQLKIRYENLLTMCTKWDKGELDFTPICSKFLLQSQLNIMYDYLKVLEERAKIEKIDLSGKANFDYKEIVMEVFDKWKFNPFTYWNWLEFKAELKCSIEDKYKISVDFRKAEFRGILKYCKGEWYNIGQC